MLFVIVYDAHLLSSYCPHSVQDNNRQFSVRHALELMGDPYICDFPILFRS